MNILNPTYLTIDELRSLKVGDVVENEMLGVHTIKKFDAITRMPVFEVNETYMISSEHVKEWCLVNQQTNKKTK